MSELTGKEKMVLTGAIANKLFWSHVVELSGVKHPNIVIDATPSPTEEHRKGLETLMASGLRKTFKANVTVFDPFDRSGDPTDSDYATRLFSEADVIYPCGGNTKKLMDIWRTTGLFKQVADDLQAGEVVVAGASAGSLIWSEWGFSDYRQYRVPEGAPWRYRTLPGRGLLPGWLNVHHSDVRSDGRTRKHFMEDAYRHSAHTGPAIGLDFCGGVLLENGTLTALNLHTKMAPSGDDGAEGDVYYYENNSPTSRQVILPGRSIPL